MFCTNIRSDSFMKWSELNGLLVDRLKFATFMIPISIPTEWAGL